MIPQLGDVWEYDGVYYVIRLPEDDDVLEHGGLIADSGPLKEHGVLRARYMIGDMEWLQKNGTRLD